MSLQSIKEETKEEVKELSFEEMYYKDLKIIVGDREKQIEKMKKQLQRTEIELNHYNSLKSGLKKRFSKIYKKLQYEKETVETKIYETGLMYDFYDSILKKV